MIFDFPLPPHTLEHSTLKKIDLNLLKEAFSVFYKKKFLVELPRTEIYVFSDKDNNFSNSNSQFIYFSNPSFWGNYYSHAQFKEIIEHCYTKNKIPVFDETNVYSIFEDNTPSPLNYFKQDLISIFRITPLNLTFAYIPMELKNKIGYLSTTHQVLENDLMTAFLFFSSKETDYYYQRVADILRMHIDSFQNKILDIKNSKLNLSTNFPKAGLRILVKGFSYDKIKHLNSESIRVIDPKLYNDDFFYTDEESLENYFGVEIKLHNTIEMLERSQYGWNNPENFISKLNPGFISARDSILDFLSKY